MNRNRYLTLMTFRVEGERRRRRHKAMASRSELTFHVLDRLPLWFQGILTLETRRNNHAEALKPMSPRSVEHHSSGLRAMLLRGLEMGVQCPNATA